MFNDEERKHIMDYESKQMMECNDKNMANSHVHVYNTLTDVADCHQHILTGVSGPADRVGRSHTHSIRTRTSFVEGHWHWVDIMTDRALVMPNDTHSHYYAGRTSMNDGHCHNFSDITTLSPDMWVVEEEEEEECVPPPKPCKYKYKRPEDDEYN